MHVSNNVAGVYDMRVLVSCHYRSRRLRARHVGANVGDHQSTHLEASWRVYFESVVAASQRLRLEDVLDEEALLLLESLCGSVLGVDVWV